jgi:osmotically inducible lipoprotein OsmB
VVRAAVAVLVLVSLAGCGYSRGERAVSGGLLGAGAGAGVSALTGGGIGTGALIGGGLGAAGGALTAPGRRGYYGGGYRRGYY